MSDDQTYPHHKVVFSCLVILYNKNTPPQDIPLSLVNLSKCLTLTLILYKGQKTAILQK